MSRSVSYKRHRFPPKIIAHAVWLYFRFPLSLRLVEEMLLERGIVVSYETVRRWALKFGPAYARRLRRRTPSRRDIWHLDEVVVTIAGKKHWLWRAVDQDGYVLDEIVQLLANLHQQITTAAMLQSLRDWQHKGAEVGHGSGRVKPSRGYRLRGSSQWGA